MITAQTIMDIQTLIIPPIKTGGKLSHTIRNKNVQLNSNPRRN
jgi:hypothetical protein